jgi:hypothetical protein
MIDTDKYEGHTEGPWQPLFNGTADSNGRASTIETQATHPPYGNKILITEIHSQPCLADPLQDCEANAQLIADAPLLLAEVKRLQKEIKVLSKYRDIVEKYDDALLADGDEDPRWSELYD